MTTAKIRPLAPASTNVDSSALAQIAKGDLWGLGELYDRYAQDLLRFARRAAPSEDAQDVVQTVFERLVRISGSYDGRGNDARSWLFGITAAVLRERTRSLRRFASTLLGYSMVERRSTAASLAASVDVERALQRLSENKRIVFLLAEVEGFTSPEIAEMLDVPVGTVWTRLHHARRELRALFGEQP